MVRPEAVTRVAGEDPLLTSAEVALLFKVEPVTVLRWAHGGRLPFIRNPGPRGQLRFRESVVRTALEGGDLGGNQDQH